MACGDHGDCNVESGRCDCAAGWSGRRCANSIAALRAEVDGECRERYPESRPTFEDEDHLECYNFCGPGTHMSARLRRGDLPINGIDALCLQHDKAYGEAARLLQGGQITHDMAAARVEAADAALAVGADQTSGNPRDVLLVHAMLAGKSFFESSGLLDPTHFISFGWCGLHGRCAEGGGCECACDAGWIGEQCDAPDPCSDTDCGAHGSCALAASDAEPPVYAAVCVCEPGYGGGLCEIRSKGGAALSSSQLRAWAGGAAPMPGGGGALALPAVGACVAVATALAVRRRRQSALGEGLLLPIAEPWARGLSDKE